MKKNILFQIFIAVLLGLGLIQSYFQLFRGVEHEMNPLFWVIVAVTFGFYFFLKVFKYKLSLESQVIYQVIVVFLNLFFIGVIIYSNRESFISLSLYLFFYLITVLIGELKLSTNESLTGT